MAAKSKLAKTLFPYGYKEDFKIIVHSSIPLVINFLFIIFLSVSKSSLFLIFASSFQNEILSNFSQVFMMISSFIFCGHIGPKEYSAATLAATFINIGGFSILVGLTTASETLFPQVFLHRTRQIARK